LGLALNLLLNGIFLAHHINNDNALTLPDVYAKRYGVTVEVLVSLCTIVSFLMLLGGNLVGMGAICSYLWSIDEVAAVWIAAFVVWAYTFTGGLFSVAYTDIVQGVMGWSGCLFAAYHLMTNEALKAPPPSIGFSSPTATYVYPNQEVCSIYQGVPCENVTDACCTSPNVTFMDNGAYPLGDKPIFANQLLSPTSLSPFPNGFLWCVDLTGCYFLFPSVSHGSKYTHFFVLRNWATIFILGFGNFAALDFQSRCMAAKSPKTARYACFIASAFTLLIGIPFSYLGAITRYVRHFLIKMQHVILGIVSRIDPFLSSSVILPEFIMVLIQFMPILKPIHARKY
jgi:Na+/proline symporter